jgi:hypothetical protein
METILAAATILGGIGAVWFFWDKIVAWWKAFTARTPPPAAPSQKWVDFRYPTDSGLQQRLENEGFNVAWCFDSRLARKTELEGWEVVVEVDRDGNRSNLKFRDNPSNQTLIKRRRQ